MKRLGKRQAGDIRPDLTSFSDIANLLIIFFILTTSLARPFGRIMDMPSSAKPPQELNQPADTPTVRFCPFAIPNFGALPKFYARTFGARFVSWINE